MDGLSLCAAPRKMDIISLCTATPQMDSVSLCAATRKMDALSLCTMPIGIDIYDIECRNALIRNVQGICRMKQQRTFGLNCCEVRRHGAGFSILSLLDVLLNGGRKS